MMWQGVGEFGTSTVRAWHGFDFAPRRKMFQATALAL
eukprot:CAMPEP_0179317502 /NCGR_PEP_ID=MMETSP0797-20121207/56300_1 /TAXON_ID=47934 /ORGANISM="Dinophysis acuminata, Strain DAEP01" /LENGTH=36 /DNA_ID= /DNA_START= /DNA_END= /DNA_ORIENTATION=